MCISNGSLWFSYYDLLDIVFVICDNNCPSLYSLQGTLQHFRLDVQDSGDGLRWWSVGEHFVPDKCWSSLSRSQAAPSWLKSITVASLGRFGPWWSAVTRWIVLQGPEICPDLWYCTICMRPIVLPIFSLILKMMTRVCAMYVHESAKYYPVRTQTISGLPLVFSLLARLTILCRGTCKPVLNSGHHWPVVFQTFLAVNATQLSGPILWLQFCSSTTRSMRLWGVCVNVVEIAWVLFSANFRRYSVSDMRAGS